MPIFEAIKDMEDRHVDIFVYYGMTDWMDSSSTAKIINLNKLKVKVDYISNSDHQILV